MLLSTKLKFSLTIISNLINKSQKEGNTERETSNSGCTSLVVLLNSKKTVLLLQLTSIHL